MPNSPANLVDRILEETRVRRAAGEQLTDAQVLAAHPELAEKLKPGLRKLALVQRARRLAEAAPASDPAALATDDTLHSAAGDSSVAHGTAPSILGYEVIREIHRGGQGVVYQAVQKSTGRRVAVKVMREGPFADASDRIRFDREIQILGALKHPNIVSIHDSGEAGGLAYFVMDFIAGSPLDLFIRDRAANVSEVFRLFAKICDAVNAAQVCGITHRDLKPGNILIDKNGDPHVLDFGLAKIVGVGTAYQVAPQTVTAAGQFIGSLPWASPEQADAVDGQIDARSDVYALGVILYQVLCGRLPYAISGNLRESLDNIQNATPTRPRLIRRDLNDEVETIILKCLQKDRARRYANAGELSGDLRRYLSGEPIDAKRDSRLYILRKHIRRHWIPVVSTVAVILALLAGVIGTTLATLRAKKAEQRAEQRASAATRMRERADWETYKSCLAAADAAIAGNDGASARARLDAAPASLRGWEWRYLDARLDQSLRSYALPYMTIGRFSVSSDEKSLLAAVPNAGVVRVDLASGQARLLGGSKTGEIVCQTAAPDGRRAALGMGSGEIRVFDLNQPEQVLEIQAYPSGRVSALAFSPDSTEIASGGAVSGGDAICVWDSRTGELRQRFGGRETWVTVLSFSPDARVIAAGYTKPDAGLRTWDRESAALLNYVDTVGLDVTDVAFNPAGTRIAVASQDSKIRLFDGDGRREIGAFTGHRAGVTSVVFNEDGSALASASHDQTIRIWNAETAGTTAVLRGHLNGVGQISFFDRDKQVVSLCSADGTVKTWECLSRADPPTFQTGKYFVLRLEYAPDGRRLYSHDRFWDTSTAMPIERIHGAARERSAWICTDESLEWVFPEPGNPGGTLLRNGRAIFETREALCYGPVLSRDGRFLALACKRGVLQIYEMEQARLIAALPLDGANAVGLCFSQDAGRLLTWGRDGRWSLLDIASTRELRTRKPFSQEIVNAAFSWDDRYFATASYDGTARIWDVRTGDEIRVLRPAAGPAGDQSVVWCVAFSPDGSRLATGSKDRRIRIWDIASGQELFAMTGHAGTVMCLAWSPDGTQLASGGYDGTVCIWDSRSYRDRRALGPK